MTKAALSSRLPSASLAQCGRVAKAARREPRSRRSSFSSSPSRRVALLTLDFPPSIGGVQQYLFELSRRVGQHCHLTVVLPRGNTSLFKEEPFEVIVVPSAMPWNFACVSTLRPHVTVVGHAHPRLLLPSAIMSRGRYMALTHGNDFEARPTALACTHLQPTSGGRAISGDKFTRQCPTASEIRTAST